MPTFCRHNRLIQNCPICSREQSIELRPVISSSAPRTGQPRERAPRPTGSGGAGRTRSRSGRSDGLRVRKLARGVDDGYHSPLLPGLRSSEDAHRLAEELVFAAGRLRRLEEDPPGLYAEVADPAGDLEERTWLAFLIAYLCPTDGPDPFESIRRVRIPWSSDELPELGDLATGPRSAHDSARGAATLVAYRAWAQRAGSQAAAFTGEAAWSAERRFARAFERLALPGLHRGARFDLLVTLGRLGVYELRAGSLEIGRDSDVTVAAKRALGIGDTLLLERRASELAARCGLPLEALDLGLYNWQTGERAGFGVPVDAELDPAMLAGALHALGLEPPS